MPPKKKTPSRSKETVVKDQPVQEEPAPPIQNTPDSETKESSSPFLPWIRPIVSAVVLAVYIQTAYPNISGGDAGELTVSVCNTGVPHPPGYPTFAMLGKLFQHLIPFSNAAWRLHIMNALLSTGAFWFLSKSIENICRVILKESNHVIGLAAGLMAAGLFAFSPTVWLYTIQAEVFPLNNLLVAALLHSTVSFFSSLTPLNDKDGSKSDPTTLKRLVVREAYIGALIGGLAMSNQHTTVFFVIPTAALVTVALFRAKLLSGWVVLQLILCVSAGMLTYLYMPLAALRQPMDSWGDQRNLDGFLTHFLRREYGTFSLASNLVGGGPGLLERVGYYLSNHVSELLWITPFLVVAGVITLARSPHSAARWVAGCVLLSWIVYVWTFSALSNLDFRPLFWGVQARFWQQPNLYLCFLAGAGVPVMCKILAQLIPAGRKICLILCVGAVAAQLGLRYDHLDHSRFSAFAESGHRTIESFPNNSLVLLNGDLNNNLLKYTQQCEGIRTDVRLIPLQLMSWDWFVGMQALHYPNVTFPGTKYHPYAPGGFSIKQFLDINQKKFPDIFICGPFKEGDSSHEGYYERAPFGVCDRLLTPLRKAKKPRAVDVVRGYSGFTRAEEMGADRFWQHTPDAWEHVLINDAWISLRVLATETALKASAWPQDDALLDIALRMFEDFSRQWELPWRDQSVEPVDLKNAGVIFGLHSKRLKSRGAPSEQVSDSSRRMLSYWARAVQLSRPGTEPAIEQLVRERINPYTGESVQGWEPTTR